MMERRRQAVGLMHAITTPGVNWLVLAEALGGPVGQAHERDAAGRIVARLGAELRLLKQDSCSSFRHVTSRSPSTGLCGGPGAA